jgi:hypothetical protein
MKTEGINPESLQSLTTEQRLASIAQLMVLQSRIIKRQTYILSGQYKKKNLSIAGEQLTDEEKLKDEFKAIERHINHMQEIQEDLY